MNETLSGDKEYFSFCYSSLKRKNIVWISNQWNDGAALWLLVNGGPLQMFIIRVKLNALLVFVNISSSQRTTLPAAGLSSICL